MEHKKNDKTSNRGRPTVLGAGDVERVIQCFESGLSITETAGFLGVSRNAVSNFLNKNPKIKSEIQSFQCKPKALAKMIIMGELEGGSVDIAKWLLEREAKREVERVRSALVRVQIKAVEASVSTEAVQEALPMGEYWARINAYFNSAPADGEPVKQADGGGEETQESPC